MPDLEKPVSVRRPILGALSILALIFLYRVFAVYTVRNGECDAKPIDPALRVETRSDHGTIVSYPVRDGFPRQERPLVIMTYNIAGHDELLDGDHIRKIAAAIRGAQPDIVALQEVHRKTWQSRFRDQLAEIEAATGMHGVFAPAYTQWGGEFGNALLTRGRIVSNIVHPLPSVGEPRTLLETVVAIDGVTLNVYVTHLSTWASLNSHIRGEQLQCLGRHVRSSRWPYLLAGDFNAGPDAPEVSRFIRSDAAQICGAEIGPTHPRMNRRIDYVFADWGWEVGSVRALRIGPSDHWPVIAELFWRKRQP